MRRSSDASARMLHHSSPHHSESILMVVASLSKAFTKVFGSRNERLVKSYRRRVEQINALEPQTRKLTDAELKAKTAEFRERVAKGTKIAEIMPEIMAVAREAMDRA